MVISANCAVVLEKAGVVNVVVAIHLPRRQNHSSKGGGRREGGVVSGTRNNVVPQQEQTTTTKEAKESSCGHTLPTEGLLSANTHGSTCSQRASVGNMTIHWAAGFGTANRMLCSPRPTFLISISQNLGSQSGRDRNIIFVIVLE